MKVEKILILLGPPKSVFSEILIKYLKKKFSKKKVIIIGDLNYFLLNKKKTKLPLRINLIDNYKNAKLNKINFINIKCKNKNNILSVNNYIKNSFEIVLQILKKDKTSALFNGPINKKTFLNKKYLGITEYISKKFNSKKTGMLIYNKNLSVCPITTHLPLKAVSRNITKKLITEKVIIVDNFYKNIIKKKPKIAILGLNPHCESIYKNNEDLNIIKPAVNNLKKQKYNVSGPFPADTFFLSQNRKKYDVVVGMYHDQVLTPLKTLFEYDAINITMGLPFIRVSPDHGPNEEMLGKNKSNPTSLIQAINFLDKN